MGEFRELSGRRVAVWVLALVLLGAGLVRLLSGGVPITLLSSGTRGVAIWVVLGLMLLGVWVIMLLTGQKIRDVLSQGLAVGVLGWVVLGVWLVTPNSIRYPVLYSLTTPAEFSDVHVDPQPHDCDWSHAPIGNKHCHYEISETCEKDGESGRIELKPKKCIKEAEYVYVRWIKRQD